MTTQWQFIAFLFVGGLNTLFGYAMYALFIYLGFDYPVAVLLATCLGVLFNFNTTGKIVFRNFRYGLFYKFVGVYVLLYFLNVAFIKFLHGLSDNLYLDGFLAIIPLAMVSFILNKYFVFRKIHEIN
jgi:putative flippase GtrA